MTTIKRRALFTGLAIAALAAGAFASPANAQRLPALEDKPNQFTIAVIPDTQNYVDFRKQTEAGFPFNAREMLFDQLSFIARHTESQGGDIAFVTGVGDIWQHPTQGIDEYHRAKGLQSIDTWITKEYAPTEKTRTVEMPAARYAYALIDGKVPFAVVPGNHDYDGFWSDSRFPVTVDARTPVRDVTAYGQLHYGGLKNWTSVFGDQSPFFKGKTWYVASFNEGANNAQIFEAGGYRFLHIGLEMAPYDNVLAWAASIVKQYEGIPTIISIHDHLNTKGERKPNPIVDFKRVHPEHNNPEDLWSEFLSKHKQIFLVLSGHQHGQSRRIDKNDAGGMVIQVLADYQDRMQTVQTLLPNEEIKARGIGDGWMRLMTFDMSAPVPVLRVRTYSTHYKAFASEFPPYAAWYKGKEKPELSDSDFIAEEEFEIPLDDFKQRFGASASIGAGKK